MYKRQEVYRGEHYAYCYAPNVCAQCSAPYHGSNVSCPYPENESSHNPETHAITCEYCGKVQYILSLVEEIQAPTCTQHGQKKMECSFCGETVSYTHLDVYKRQLYTIIPASRWRLPPVRRTMSVANSVTTATGIMALVNATNSAET